MAEEIVNRVAKSGIVSLDLEDLFPGGERIVFDLKQALFQGMVLKEKDFRDFIKEHDWEKYTGKHVAITCSTDAIIPVWAYMLITSMLQPFAETIIYGTKEQLDEQLVLDEIKKLDAKQYTDARVVVKGCGNVPVSAYIELSKKVLPYVKSLMFGEPCSTVPVYKKPKK